jgi:hypothetical protein
MNTIDFSPINNNFLNPSNFKFVLKRAPNVEFFLQKIDPPSIILGVINVPTQFVSIPWPDTRLAYEPLSIEFKIDENMQNYLEIYQWINDIAPPESYAPYANMIAQDPITGNGLRSDISLIVSNSAKHPNYNITFKDCFPYQLSLPSFRTTDENTNYVSASAKFAFVSLQIDKIN